MDNSNSTNPKIPLILRARELEDELLEVNGTLSSWLIHYCNKAGIPIPDREGLYYLIKRTTEILDELKQLRIYQPRGNTYNITEEGTEPDIRFCIVDRT